MVIDRILDALEIPESYDAETFYRDISEYMTIFNDIPTIANIARALDCGNNTDVQNAICDYIISQNYNSKLIPYVRKFTWLKDNE